MELHCHGSPGGAGGRAGGVVSGGSQACPPGEFTKRAFLNGQMDLTQAEAVIDLIEAETADAAANAAGQVGGALARRLEPVYSVLTDLCSHFHAVLDYPDEDIDEFRLSSYTGALAGAQETLTARWPHPPGAGCFAAGGAGGDFGQTQCGQVQPFERSGGISAGHCDGAPRYHRDTVEETVLVGSVRLRLVDTAGIREASDQVEAFGGGPLCGGGPGGGFGPVCL